MMHIAKQTSEILSEKQIADAEKHYAAQYVSDLCIKNRSGRWTGPVAVFYVSTPSKPEYSNYLGFYRRDGSVWVTDALSAVSEPLSGIVADDGEVVFSRSHHDFRRSTDGSVYADGGREYSRYGLSNNNPFRTARIVIENGELKIFEVENHATETEPTNDEKQKST